MRTNDDELIRALGGLRDAEAADDLVARSLADAAFEAARRDRPAVSEMLMARILRDARAVARRRRRQGWGALGGLVAASVLGVAIGFSDPGGLIAAALPADTAYDDIAGAYEFQVAELAP